MLGASNYEHKPKVQAESTPHTPEDTTLDYCPTCNQMTNHREGICQKCKAPEDTIVERVRNWFFDRNPKTITSDKGGFFFSEADVISAIVAYGEAQKAEGAREERERWINQPANEHDNRIREEERERCIKIVDNEYIRFTETGKVQESEYNYALLNAINALTPKDTEVSK